MAASEWTHFVRVVRATRVVHYSALGANTSRHIAFRPPITVSPCLLALSVSPCKRTLWRCGQLWPYVAIGLLGTSAKRKSVRNPDANLTATMVAFTSASKYFQMLPSPPEALQSALRLCKSILRMLRDLSLSIIFVFDTVTGFATLYCGMNYLSISIYIHTVNLAIDGSRASSEEHLQTPIKCTKRMRYVEAVVVIRRS